MPSEFLADFIGMSRASLGIPAGIIVIYWEQQNYFPLLAKTIFAFIFVAFITFSAGVIVYNRSKKGEKIV